MGKTAVVEGFALRVRQGDVPPPSAERHVRTLDLALLQAGAGIKGEFENRLKGLIEEVKSSPTPIILFIDEAHTMIGAGGQAGQNDAANLLKPALARGELRTIAATTWSEYKKYFEKDPALARRFQVVKVEEPAEAQCMVMLRGIVPALEKHHNVRILDEGLGAAVQAFAPLSAGPAASGQGGERARHRLRAPRAGPERHAAGDRRRHPPDRRSATCRTRMLEREAALGRGSRRAAGSDRRRRRRRRRRAWPSCSARWEKERDLVGTIREMRGQARRATRRRAEAAATPQRSRAAAGAAPAAHAQPRIPRPCARNWRRSTPNWTRAAGRESADARLRGRADRGRSGVGAGPASPSARW